MLAVLALAALPACSLRNVACGLPQGPAEGQPVPGDLGAAATPSGQPTVGIAFLGDSLTAGFGLLSEDAYPAVIGQMFADEGYPEVQIINAGVSGDTTAGGLRRVDALFEPEVRILVVALGGNDALRGLTTLQTKQNLTAIVDRAKAAGRDVLLAGMQAPTNLGPDYQLAFRQLYVDIAVSYGDSIEFVPFLLEGVAGNPALNQPDGIHPTAEGSKIVAGLLYPRLRVLVDLHLGSGGGGE
jgi:acyl-CoA thioesterase-1